MTVNDTPRAKSLRALLPCDHLRPMLPAPRLLLLLLCAAAAAGAARAAPSCTASFPDCEANGECVAGRCACYRGWTGASCGSLDLLPAALPAARAWPLAAGQANASSWGFTRVFTLGDSSYHALVTVACGAAGVLPLLHFLWLNRAASAPRGEWALGLQLLQRSALMGAQYIAGAALFGLRIPERFAPGRFDYFPSHAFFPVLVVTAVLTHWGTVKGLWLWRSCGAETLF